MKEVRRTLVLVMLAALVFGGMLYAEDRDRGGAVRGTFVRLVEQQVGEHGYMSIVIKPLESDDRVTVLVPRQPEELGQAVRRLREGQKVGISFVSDGGHRWIRRLETERREGAKERPEGRRALSIRREVVERREGAREGRPAARPLENLEKAERELKEILGAHFGRIARQFRELMSRVERMERELRELRAENERLRRQLRDAGGPRREREGEVRKGREVDRRREGREREEREVRREPERRRGRQAQADRERPREREVAREADPSLPDGMIGFRGVLIGRIVRKLDRGFVLKVEKIANVWEHNRADNPEAAVGKELIITIRADEELGGRFLRALRALETGERVLVEAFHFEGNRLTVVEQLQRSD